MAKSIRELGWNVSEETYRDNNILSYSILSKYLSDGFENLDHLFDKEDSQALRFGSMVDCLVFDGQEEFDKKYFVCVIQDTTDDFKKVCAKIYEEIGSMCPVLDSLPDKGIVEYLDLFGIYQNNWKVETKASKFRESAGAYYLMLHSAEGRTIISKDTYDEVVACVNAVKNNPATEWYFRKDNKFDGIERIYQLKLKGEYSNIPIRCMIDLLIVDHKNKRIIPCDLKTSSDPEFKFPSAFLKWHYFIQAGLYTYLIKKIIEDDDYFKDFKVEDFRFIVVSKANKTPLVWVWDKANTVGDIKIYTQTNRAVIIKDWRDILVELNGYLKYRPAFPNNIVENVPNDIFGAISEW